MQVAVSKRKRNIIFLSVGKKACLRFSMYNLTWDSGMAVFVHNFFVDSRVWLAAQCWWAYLVIGKKELFDWTQI